MHSRRCLVSSLAGLVVPALFASAALAANHNVTVTCCSFTPSYLEIAEGDSVTWIPDGFVLHTVTSGLTSAPADNPGVLFDATLPSGFTTPFAFTFNTPGNVPYFCRPHELAQMKGTIVVRCANPDTACRAGNVDTGPGGVGPSDVLTVNGSAGTPPAREVVVTANASVSIGIVNPPQGGPGLYAIWRIRGEPCMGDATAAVLNTSSGTQPLGTSCFCLPVNNTVTPGSCPCSRVLGTGFVSKPIFGAAAANNVCLHRAPADAKAPTTLTTTFPPGVYSVTGLIFDRGSAFGPKKVSLTNTVVVLSRP
jgi:plastocyanin